ncbi:unnamed protein product [Ilex paraguariensis]|uniref:Secreted protein n=1 Tax=Ilex paraguariensis TaxID=185542 RepID=A0ABC8QWC7_9AQUA
MILDYFGSLFFFGGCWFFFFFFRCVIVSGLLQLGGGQQRGTELGGHALLMSCTRNLWCFTGNCGSFLFNPRNNCAFSLGVLEYMA